MPSYAKLTHHQWRQFDFLVLGSGLAGLSAALHASRYGSVALITKSTLEQSNSYLAQGGVAAVVDPGDSVALHMQDTLNAGRGHCNVKAVEVLVREGRERILELINLGMQFDGGDEGFSLGLEGGHSMRRILHAGGASTGREIIMFLLKLMKQISAITVFERSLITELVVFDKTCLGARILGDDNRSWTAFARATIVAMGGACGIYPVNTNQSTATGDGIVLAYRAGAAVADMEFVQFHPTVFRTDDGEAILITEAVRGEGAYLVDGSGQRFMLKHHERGELATRDIVTRAITEELENTGSASMYLTLRHLDKAVVKSRFPALFERIRGKGLDLTRDLIPVKPAAHYMIGGIKTGLWGETNIRGLFACGEAASTGVHGANRLASNSLLECMVFARRAVEKAKDLPAPSTSSIRQIVSKHPDGSLHADSKFEKSVMNLRARVSELINDYAGILRGSEGLKTLLCELAKIHAEGSVPLSGEQLQLRNMKDVCEMIARSALTRTESRGVHTRVDFPEENKDWGVRIVLMKGREPAFESV